MKIKISEASNLVLNYLVAKAEGFRVEVYENGDVWVETHGPTRTGYITTFPYSTDWGLAGPIIEREKTTIGPYSAPRDGEWHAYIGWDDVWLEPLFEASGPTPLVAAMRCFVESKLAHEVEVPEELLK